MFVGVVRGGDSVVGDGGRDVQEVLMPRSIWAASLSSAVPSESVLSAPRLPVSVVGQALASGSHVAHFYVVELYVVSASSGGGAVSPPSISQAESVAGRSLLWGGVPEGGPEMNTC